MGVVTPVASVFIRRIRVAVSAYMGVVTERLKKELNLTSVAVSAYMGVVTKFLTLIGHAMVLQSPPTWEL